MQLRPLAIALLCAGASAQTQIDWTNSTPGGSVTAVCFDVPGRTIYSTCGYGSPWIGELRSVDTQGQTVWTVQTQVSSTPIWAQSLAFDGSGFIAGAGVSLAPSGEIGHSYVVVYDLGGTPMWFAKCTGPNGEMWNSVRVAGFASGGPVLVGTFGENAAGLGRDLCIIAYGAAGAVRWQWSGATTQSENVSSTAVAGNGDVYVVGVASQPSPWPGFGFVTKVGASGAMAWTSESIGDGYKCIAVDAQHRPHVGGSRADVGSSRLLMLGLDPSTGQERYARTIPSDASSTMMMAIAVGANGDVVATGRRYISLLGIGNHAFTLALDANGTERWREAHRAPLPDSGAFATSIDIDSAGNVVIAGYEIDQHDTIRPFVVKYPRSTAPAVGWLSNASAGLPASEAVPRAVRLDEDQSVRAVGIVYGGASTHIGAWRLAPSARTTCIGDGATVTCPCGNQSTSFERAGCANTLGVGGTLEWSGVPSIGGDTLRFIARSMPSTSTALLVQGLGVAISPSAFGDGLTCVGGPLVGLGRRSVVGGQAIFPGGAPTPLSVLGGVVGPGAVHTYQVRYRNAVAFCTSETSNATNAIEVTWSL